MKIKTIKLFCIITLLFLASCTPEEKNNKATNPLTGTKWATSYADYYMVIEFTSENQVQGYFAKGSSLTYHNGLTNGSYSVSGSNVTFNNFDIIWNAFGSRSHYKPQTGTFSGSIMQTKGQSSIYSDNDWHSWDKTWNKQ